MRARRSRRRLGALATNVEKSGALARPRLCGACGACRREMQVIETQSSHRRHACRERARNAPHLRCKKRGSASAASIIASHGWRAGATYGTERHGWLQGCAVHPSVQCIRCVGNVASAVQRVQWGMRATGQEVRCKWCDTVQAQWVQPPDSPRFHRIHRDSSSIRPPPPGTPPIVATATVHAHATHAWSARSACTERAQYGHEKFAIKLNCLQLQ